jgi:hypothetical protein
MEEGKIEYSLIKNNPYFNTLKALGIAGKYGSEVRKIEKYIGDASDYTSNIFRRLELLGLIENRGKYEKITEKGEELFKKIIYNIDKNILDFKNTYLECKNKGICDYNEINKNPYFICLNIINEHGKIESEKKKRKIINYIENKNRLSLS